jgi:hypothetical protein
MFRARTAAQVVLVEDKFGVEQLMDARNGSSLNPRSQSQMERDVAAAALHGDA